MHACMHVCMYACMHVCMYACMQCMYACMHVCMYACMHVCMYACMHVCMYACMHVCTYARMHACTYILTMYVYRRRHSPDCVAAHAKRTFGSPPFGHHQGTIYLIQGRWLMVTTCLKARHSEQKFSMPAGQLEFRASPRLEYHRSPKACILKAESSMLTVQPPATFEQLGRRRKLDRAGCIVNWPR